MQDMIMHTLINGRKLLFYDAFRLVCLKRVKFIDTFVAETDRKKRCGCDRMAVGATTTF
jgi:hypothetical protein